jgi:3',5'-cyclic-AMP phosphodiesterase
VSVTLLQISDTHLRVDPSYSHRVLGSPDDQLHHALAGIDLTPDLVVLSGDLADDGSVEGLQRLRAATERFEAPVLAVAGNHDRQAAIDEVFGRAAATELGGWRIVPIETLVEGRDDGRVDATEAAALLDDDRLPTAVVMHHPPRSNSTNPIFVLEGAETFTDVLAERPHVRLVLSGHLHEVFALRAGHATVLGAPSSYFAMHHDGPTFRPVFDEPVGARVIELHPDGSFDSRVISRTG